MASALAGGLSSGGLEGGAKLFVVDHYPATKQAFAKRFDATALDAAVELADKCDVVFLCVKPCDVSSALPPEIQDALANKLLISVVAGCTLDTLRELVGRNCQICRSMPNTAAAVLQSATAVCFSENCSETNRALAKDAFGVVGEVFDLPEKMFHAVVGVSGSGPAYACLLIEAMSDGGVAAGLSRAVATRLAALAVRGAAALVLETNQHPAELREKISSPSGTTIAALAKMEAGAVRYHVGSAVEAAAARSMELSEGK